MHLHAVAHIQSCRLLRLQKLFGKRSIAQLRRSSCCSLLKLPRLVDGSNGPQYTIRCCMLLNCPKPIGQLLTFLQSTLRRRRSLNLLMLSGRSVSTAGILTSCSDCKLPQLPKRSRKSWMSPFYSLRRCKTSHGLKTCVDYIRHEALTDEAVVPADTYTSHR